MRKVDTSHFKTNSHNPLRWVGRGCLFASTIGVFIASYHFYDPHYYPFSGLDSQTGQALLNGGFLLAITGFAWVWPAPGGIIAMIYGGFKLPQVLSDLPLTLTPAPLYFALYGVFIIGGIQQLLVGLRPGTAVSYTKFGSDKRMQWMARITTFASIIIFIIVFTTIYPKWWIFGCIPALILAGIAWIWPTPGGILIVLFCASWFPPLISSNYDIEMKALATILCIGFLVGGILHLVAVWRQRKKI